MINRKFLLLLVACCLPVVNAEASTPSDYPTNYKEVVLKWLGNELMDASTARIQWSADPKPIVAVVNGQQVPGYVVYFKVNARNQFGAYTGWQNHGAVISGGQVVQGLGVGYKPLQLATTPRPAIKKEEGESIGDALQSMAIKEKNTANDADRRRREPFENACKRFGVATNVKAGDVPGLQPGQVYVHYGYVLQVTGKMMLVDRVGIKEGEAWAMLVFQDPQKMDSVSFEAGSWVEAIVRFQKFSDVPLNDGSNGRIAVFTCLGFSPVGGEFVDTSQNAP